MLPLEMRQRAQWVVAGADKRPQYWSGGLRAASVTDDRNWMSYNDAVSLAMHLGLSIGFVLSENDPFICIDFDVKDSQTLDKNGLNYPQELWTPEVVIKQQDFIINSINSYKELSVSGKGIHLWCMGQSGPGARRGGVEVYSRERFIICTGQSFVRIERNIVSGNVQTTLEKGVCGLTEQDEFLANVLAALHRDEVVCELVELEPTEEDSVVIERAIQASNGEKFAQLARGEWAALGYPSQSEADYSLMSMLTFYSKSNSQCRRIFRMTELGKREKANKNDTYLNRCLIGIRAREANDEERRRQLNLDGLLLAKQFQGIEINHSLKPITEEVEIPTPFEDCPFQSYYDFNETFELKWPPGFLGEVAKFIYSASPRPVMQVSIVSALGLFAGVTGRGYHINQTGLNVYLILIAQSAVGKEAMHSGISYIVKSLLHDIPSITNFIDFDEHASGPALNKAVSENPSFLNICGEFGQRIAEMAMGAAGPTHTLKKTMTHLYQKSGPSAIVGGIKYSNKEGNAKSTQSVAYSLIGESTPGTLFNSITEDMMEDGFLSRFTMIQYEGERVGLNHNININVPESLKNLLVKKFKIYISATSMEGHFLEVKLTTSAWLIQFDFNLLCDKKINSETLESRRQMWNRAHIKALRFAALLAVADNEEYPYVTLDHMRWAINVILLDIKTISEKMNSGDIGVSDDGRITKLKQVAREYLMLKNDELERYGIDKRMRENSIVPRKFLQMRTCGVNAFRVHKMGSTTALNQAISTLIDNGEFKELDKITLEKEYNAHGKCYRILKI